MTDQIIVCDDEPHIIRAISLKLTRAGFNVQGAIDADSCWKMLHRDHHQTTLLIVDDAMPDGGEGIELVERMRAENMQIPVVVLSSLNADQFVRSGQAVDLGIEQVVEKPFSPRKLLELVNDILQTEKAAPVVATPSMARRYATSLSR